MDKGEIKFDTFSIMNNGRAAGRSFHLPGGGGKVQGDPADFYDLLAINPFQTHSQNIGIVEDNKIRSFPDTDALVTFKDDVAIGVRTADCVPILIHAEDVNGIAAIHAGWKGTLGGIVDNTIDVLVEHGAAPSKMKVAFGPSISKTHYEVGKELAEKFVEAGFGDYVSYPEGSGGKPHLDLQGVNMERFLRRGVPRENITLSDYCTFSSRDKEGRYRFPSYRRDKTSERILTSIINLNQKKLEEFQ